VLDNPTNFQNPFSFEITFECLQELDDGEFFFVVVVVVEKETMCDTIQYNTIHVNAHSLTHLFFFNSYYYYCRLGMEGHLCGQGGRQQERYRVG
jgi:hypothetical protein